MSNILYTFFQRGVLELLAEKSEILFPTNEPVLRELLAHGDPENKIAPVKIRHEPEITHIEPLQYSKSLYHLIFCYNHS